MTRSSSVVRITVLFFPKSTEPTPGLLGPIYISKVDITDGFYRIWLLPRDIPKLRVLFPTAPGQPELIAFPLMLPMSWVKLAPFFCMATETVADLANVTYTCSTAAPPHHLASISETPVPPPMPPTHMSLPTSLASAQLTQPPC